MHSDEIQKLKFALLEAESRADKARRDQVEAEVDIQVLRERLRQLETAEQSPEHSTT